MALLKKQTYYEKQVLKLQKELYPKTDLVTRIVKAKDHMVNNYHSPIDLDEIAAVASFSKFHFIRLFKSLYGCTPHQYLSYARISEAKSLLRYGESVLATSAAVGFCSVTSFTALFKKITGSPPSAYIRFNKPNVNKAILKR
ncbi:MAG: AraC family transcriptional regulator [Chryseolinea sp.]